MSGGLIRRQEAFMNSEKTAKSQHVLVVDDVSATRALLRDMLMSLGFENVSTARNGSDALQKVHEQEVDLILSDQIMDGMSGTEFLERLRRIPGLAETPFIMVSSVRDAPIIDTALTLGVDDYLVKPISMGLLQRKIEDVFRRRASICVNPT
jgi:two-component system chemotaxis response regulator CheY